MPDIVRARRQQDDRSRQVDGESHFHRTNRQRVLDDRRRRHRLQRVDRRQRPLHVAQDPRTRRKPDQEADAGIAVVVGGDAPCRGRHIDDRARLASNAVE